METFAICTLGCKVNQYDSQAMAEIMINAGYRKVDFREKADIYIINTCTVTNTADKKSRQAISKAHKNNGEAIICVCGCMSQKNAKQVLEIEGVSCVVGTEGRGNIANIIKEASGGKVNAVVDDKSSFENLTVTSAGEKTRGYIKIQEGCNNFCSYCIIPYARGRVRSRASEQVTEEARKLAQRGIREVVLTGIHISSYGMDSGESLAQVICDTDKIDGIDRIRLGSLEQSIITRDFLEKMKSVKSLCPHFHLSLQSGSDSVLKRMNRKYTSKEFYERVLLLREYFDNPAITTDIITGFPGETREEFLQTVEFAKKCRFSKIHVFPYSEREGTVAAKMQGSVPMEVRRKRANFLIEEAKKLENEFLREHLCEKLCVIFEQETGGGLCEGHTEKYLKVRCRANPGEEIFVLPKEIKDCIIYAERM